MDVTNARLHSKLIRRETEQPPHGNFNSVLGACPANLVDRERD